MIPKKIHYCWVGGSPIPEKNMKCIESWKRFCPDYEIIEWNESNYDFSKNRYMKEAYEAGKWGFVPDYARLDIIYNHGGIYLDTDVELIKPLDELLYNNAYCGFENIQLVNLGLGFGGIAGFSLFKKMRDSYNDISFINQDGSLNLVPSPFLQTDFLTNYGLKKNGGFQVIEGLSVYPVEYFAPLSLSTRQLVKTENTYSIHWFDGSWLDKAQRESSDVYESLYRQALINESEISKNTLTITRGEYFVRL
ncbi:MAG TPA: glycosyl transferase [Clostridiaceae bacterium]|nr:glycosyl transferase [Clostridiaceae bacterium]